MLKCKRINYSRMLNYALGDHAIQFNQIAWVLAMRVLQKSVVPRCGCSYGKLQVDINKGRNIRRSHHDGRCATLNFTKQNPPYNFILYVSCFRAETPSAAR